MVMLREAIATFEAVGGIFPDEFLQTLGSTKFELEPAQRAHRFLDDSSTLDTVAKSH